MTKPSAGVDSNWGDSTSRASLHPGAKEKSPYATGSEDGGLLFGPECRPTVEGGRHPPVFPWGFQTGAGDVCCAEIPLISLREGIRRSPSLDRDCPQETVRGYDSSYAQISKQQLLETQLDSDLRLGLERLPVL